MKTSAIGLLVLSASAMLVACGGGAGAVDGRGVVLSSATTFATSAAHRGSPGASGRGRQRRSR